MALKSSHLSTKLKVKSSSAQTEMVYFKHIIKREVDLKKREDMYEIKNFNIKQQFDDIEKDARRIRREIEIKEHALNVRNEEIEKMEKLLSERYQKQIEYPYTCLRLGTKELKSFYSNIDFEDESLEFDPEYQKFVKQPKN